MSAAKHAPAPHAARFHYVAWHVAPRVMAAEIHKCPDGGSTRIVYACGHEGLHAQHFSHSLNDQQGYKCGACGRAKAATLPEFAGWYDEHGAAIAKAPGSAS